MNNSAPGSPKHKMKNQFARRTRQTENSLRLELENETSHNTIRFLQKYENKNHVYYTDHPSFPQFRGSAIPSGAFNDLIRDILRNTNYIVELYQDNVLIKKGSQGNHGGFADLMIDENPSIKFGSIEIISNKEDFIEEKTHTLHISLSFYDNITNTIKTATYSDDDILSQTFTIISRENICEVIYKDKTLLRPLTTMGVKPIKVKNTDLLVHLSLKQPHIEKYQSNMMALDNNLIFQCNLMEIVDLFEFKTVQGKRLFSTMIRGPLIDKEEILRKQKIAEFFSERNIAPIQDLLTFYPDLIKIAKRIENGRISLNDVIFIFQILQRKDYMYDEFKKLLQQGKNEKPNPKDLFAESHESKQSSEHKNSISQNTSNIETDGFDLDISMDSQEIYEQQESTKAQTDHIDDDNSEEIKSPQISIYDEIIRPLELISFDDILSQIDDLVDIEESALKCTTEAIQNIKHARNELLRHREEEIKRISSIFDKKMKIENFTIRISRKDYNQKVFEKNCFVERSVLKGGVVFTTKTLNDLEIKECELKEIENKEERRILNFLADMLRDNVNSIMAFNMIIAIIDCYCGISNRLNDPEWCIPTILAKKDVVNGTDDIDQCEIDRFTAKNAFHPLVQECIKNDINFSFSILTGPNTAGKSTFLKTIAIIVILGQMGCAVPAEVCEFRLRKGIFMRAGAHDIPGYSTFMLEMIDMARIVKNAGPDALVLIDELGRGTSAIDGISLCIAIKEHLQKVKCSTIFATHFNDEPLFFENVKEFICSESVDGFITYKIIEGVAESHGIEVAKKLGFPQEIIDVAENYSRSGENFS